MQLTLIEGLVNRPLTQLLLFASHHAVSIKFIKSTVCKVRRFLLRLSHYALVDRISAASIGRRQSEQCRKLCSCPEHSFSTSVCLLTANFVRSDLILRRPSPCPVLSIFLTYQYPRTTILPARPGSNRLRLSNAGAGSNRLRLSNASSTVIVKNGAKMTSLVLCVISCRVHLSVSSPCTAFGAFSSVFCPTSFGCVESIDLLEHVVRATVRI